MVVGKYLSPRLYVNYGIGLFSPINTFTIRYLLGRNWSIQAQQGAALNGQGQATGVDVLYTVERGKGGATPPPPKRERGEDVKGPEGPGTEVGGAGGRAPSGKLRRAIWPSMGRVPPNTGPLWTPTDVERSGPASGTRSRKFPGPLECSPKPLEHYPGALGPRLWAGTFPSNLGPTGRPGTGFPFPGIGWPIRGPERPTGGAERPGREGQSSAISSAPTERRAPKVREESPAAGDSKAVAPETLEPRDGDAKALPAKARGPGARPPGPVGARPERAEFE